MLSIPIRTYRRLSTEQGSVWNRFFKTLSRSVMIAWDVSEFHRSHGKRRIDFNRIANIELRALCKAQLLEERLYKGIGLATFYLRRDGYELLSNVICDRSVFSLNDNDFNSAQRLLDNGPNPRYRLAFGLRPIGIWLAHELDLRITFEPRREDRTNHGFHGTDQGRGGKASSR